MIGQYCPPDVELERGEKREEKREEERTQREIEKNLVREKKVIRERKSNNLYFS